ncbi:MAG: NAD(P)/FAD-dependent oxidoreductase, partial [Chloroflexi bacterium]|nr:NAD(P)/FAD-dependent oxidoreductase [Chloroflexota bacterium]
KNLIEAAKLLYDARDPRYPGLTGRDLGLDFRTLIAQKDEVIAGYREKKYFSIFDEGHDVPIVRGQARLLDAHTVMVEGPEGTTRLEGEQILIALGSSPVIPAIDGLRDVPYLTSDLLTSEGDLELTALPESLVVIGGGYIAVELGQMFSRFGTKVTLLERGARLLSAYEPEIGLALGDILRAEGLDVRTGARVVRVQPDHAGVVITAEIDGREQEVAAARVLVTTGRQPNTAGVGLEDAGVRLDRRGAIAVDDVLRTSVPHIWAAGDIIGAEQGSQMATPVGARDGGIAAHNALSGEAPRRVDHRVIPRAVFTDPQVGVVGLTDEEANAAGHTCWCNTVSMDLVPRAGAIRDTRGVIKMVADADTHEVLGVSMLGANAAEVIHEAAMGRRFHATIDDFIDLLHVYPTMAEALKIVAISRYKDPGKLSCCAE